MVVLSIGIPTHNDFDGVYATLQALRLYQSLKDTEIVVIDTCGCDLTRSFIESLHDARYVLATDATGSAAARNRVFAEARGKAVLCCDSHVMLVPGVVKRLREFYRKHPKCIDLLQGPRLNDDLTIFAPHHDPVWSDRWSVDLAKASDRFDVSGKAFEVPMMALGAFSCRKKAWPGFHPAFSGSGGDEGYIHEKFRQRGARCLCLPWFRWVRGTSHPPGSRESGSTQARLRNYLIGFMELGLDVTPVREHFARYLPTKTIAAVEEDIVQLGLISLKAANPETVERMLSLFPGSNQTGAFPPLGRKANKKKPKSRLVPHSLGEVQTTRLEEVLCSGDGDATGDFHNTRDDTSTLAIPGTYPAGAVNEPTMTAHSSVDLVANGKSNDVHVWNGVENRHREAEKKLAIIVPVKNRDAYLEVFLDAVPRYLREVNGLSEFKIFIAEQHDDAPFNLSLARNIGARFALDEDLYDYLIFHDVDLIPIENVDYSYRHENVCWFMKPGTCKIHTDAFREANGYNPSVWGWCSEDYEFYSRIIDFGHPMKTWHQIPESNGAVIVDLDMDPQSREACVEHSKRYFDHAGDGPLLISYNLTDNIRPSSQVPKKGWQMENWHFERLSNRHREIIDFLVSMPQPMKRQYANLYGANWVNRDKVATITDTEELCHVRYRWFDVVD